MTQATTITAREAIVRIYAAVAAGYLPQPKALRDAGDRVEVEAYDTADLTGMRQWAGVADLPLCSQIWISHTLDQAENRTWALSVWGGVQHVWRLTEPLSVRKPCARCGCPVSAPDAVCPGGCVPVVLS